MRALLKNLRQKPRAAIFFPLFALAVVGITAQALWRLGINSTADRNPGSEAAPGRHGNGQSEPVGQEIYQQRLAKIAGHDLDAAQLTRLAEQATAAFEARLDEIAATLGDEDWRVSFARLKQQHPQDSAAVLETYRQDIDRMGEYLQRHQWLPMPSTEVEVVEIGNPIFRRYFSLAMYLDSRLAVTLAPPDAEEGDSESRSDSSADSVYLRNHCRVCIPPLVAHEVWPGHHVAYERAEIIPEGPERLTANRENVAYHEGWALYAEWLMIGSDYYSDAEFQLGAWRMLYLRALRASVDPSLHLATLSAADAEEIYRDKAAMTADAARSEVARHLKDPGLKASYFIGLLQILELRRQVLDQPDAASLFAFHDRFLGRPRPIPTVAREAFGVELTLPENLPASLARPETPSSR